MRYYKLETNQSYLDTEPHLFREDGFYEAVDNIIDEFYPITISVITKREYMNDVYGKGR